MKKVILIVLAAIIAYAIISSSNEKEKEENAYFWATPAYVFDEMSMGTMFDEFRENEVRAKQKYDNQKIKISGRVSDISMTISDEPLITIKRKVQQSFLEQLFDSIDDEVRFYFKKDEKNKVAKINKGDWVVLSGKFWMYYLGSNIAFNQSIIEEHSEERPQQKQKVETPKVETSAVVNSKSSEDTTKDDVLVALFLWDDLHNSMNGSLCDEVYASSVKYYWSDYTPEKIRKSKSELFSKYPEFSQTIDNISFGQFIDNRVRVDFDKEVTTSSSAPTKTYPSYLVFENIDGTWKVIEESDLITDKNMAKKQQ